MSKALMFAGLLGAALGCESEAIGVSACRQVEGARCSAAFACGFIDDIEACRRFTRDNCLHGLKLEEAPRETSVERCVETIANAEVCAERQGPDTRPFDCRSPVTERTSAKTVCDLVFEPEQALECQFLLADEEPPKLPGPDAASDAGTGDAG